MDMKRKSLRFSVPLAAILCFGGMGIIGPAAQAGTGACTLGYACLWQNNDYNGTDYGKLYNGSVVSTMDNKASSAASNGKTCSKTRFYDSSNGTGKYFELSSQYLVGSNYRDPNLSNGAGVGPYSGENWSDRVSYIAFSGGTGCK